jgi:dienelactone hydrolase
LQAITYQVGGLNFKGYLADGSGGTSVPGVLVAHEGGGFLTDHSLERAQMLADLGYVAFALDLFGEPRPNVDQAKAIVRELRADPPMLQARVSAALDLLRRQANVDPRRLAAIGFCFGGTAVLELARSGAELACTVGFHAGLGTSAPASPNRIRGKVLVCLGSQDPIVSAEQRDAFAAEMSAAAVDWQMHLYGGVGHSFTNREIDNWKIPGFAYHSAADRRSWAAMRALLDEVL